MRKALFVAAAALSLWLAPGALAAGWCGTGTTTQDLPDIVTGRQVHAIVALPADAPDTFAVNANRLADDTATMTSWWLGQDPTRSPRFDLAQFSTGTCLDISFVRLPGSASSYAGLPVENASVQFKRVSSELAALGFNLPGKKYYVYFDGPSVATSICGTGAGELLDGPAYAVVWLNGCSNIHTDYVGTHELLHALGAVPRLAPNLCNSGHVCDSPDDIMNAQTSGQPLSVAILDVGHDDYYAHSGSWEDIQDSEWLHPIGVSPVSIKVVVSGAGSVDSDIPGINCTALCSTDWDPNQTMILTATSARSSRFVRWAGACSGVLEKCQLRTTQPASATAVFGPLRIPLKVTTAGKGAVKCTPRCTKTFPGGDELTLRAVARKGWRFTGWSGGCKGTRPVCRPATDFALSVRATFRRR